MAKPIPPGACGEAQETVAFEHTLSAHHPSLPPVYSTPDMIRTAINIEHRAASAAGARVKAEAVLESYDGRFYTMRVRASDGEREIGRGTVGRVVVSVSKFLGRLNNASRNS